MKEATGEVSMTVVTIILIVIVLGIATALFGKEDSVGRKWINDTFTKMTNRGDTEMDNANNPSGTGAVDGNGAIDG